MTERRGALLLALVAVALFLALAQHRPPLGTVWGDEGTYVAMAESFAGDGDLRYDDRDRERLTHAECPGIILQQPTDGRLAYSKPVLYPLAGGLLAGLLGAPEHAASALLAVNVLSLALTLVVLGRRFERLGPPGRASLALVTVIAGGALLPYVLWRMTEALEVGLVVAGLALALPRPVAGVQRERTERGAGNACGPLAPGLLGAALLGLAASLRYPNLAIAAAPVLAALLLLRPLRAAALAAALVAALAGALLLTRALAGSPDPYRSVRAGFDCETGYPTGNADPGTSRFVTERATNDVVSRPFASPRTIGYATLYFLTGRHTGVLVYFPAMAALTLVLLRRARDPAVVSVLLGCAALLGFYLVYMPENYFGGGTVVGNRYALPALAALAVALPALPSLRVLALCWAVAAAAGLSALVSVARTSARDRTSQSHANAGLFRLLPYESTAPDLDGRRDRYWSEELVRFVDPYADAGPASFQLRSGAPGADLLVANRRGRSPMRFLVAAESDALELRIQELGWTRTYPLVRSPAGGVRSVVDYVPLPAWRRHPFWWAPRTVLYDAHLIRISVRASPSGGEATLRYLGDGAALRASLGRVVLAAEAPASAPCGSRSTLRLQVRNTGDTTWSPDAVLPVQVGFRIEKEGAAGPSPEAVRSPLPRNVIPGGDVDIELPVVWPDEPGTYRVRADLVLEEVAWFAERNGGAPLLDARVELVPAR